MANRPTKGELLAKARELGIDADESITNKQLGEAIKAAGEQGAKPGDAAGAGNRPAKRTVSCPEGYDFLNVRAQPSRAARILRLLPNGAEVRVASEGDGWTAIDGGYVQSKYLA